MLKNGINWILLEKDMTERCLKRGTSKVHSFDQNLYMYL